MQRNEKRLFFWVIGWRIIVAIAVAGAVASLPFTPTFANPQLMHNLGPRWLSALSQFDGLHYLTIADKGYVGTGLIQAFFPLYPFLIRILSLGLFNPVWVGMGISLLSLMAGMWLLFRLIKIDYQEQVAVRIIVLMLLSPTAFFFAAVYNEGLFFFLSVLAFYLSRKQWWWLAGLVGALAATTRLIGVLLVFGLIIEYYLYTNKSDRKIGPIIACFLPLVGLGLFMVYLEKTFGDPILFYHVQAGFGAGRDAGGLVLLPQVFYRYIKIFLSLQPDWVLWYRTSLEFAAGILGLTLAIMAFWKIRLSYAVYAALAFMLPTLTGNFSSMPRYLLPLFPLFLVLAKVLGNRGYIATLIIFVILQVVSLVLFTQGIFIS